MKILHTIPSMGVNSGGPALSTMLTVRGLRDKGIHAEILSYDIAGCDDKLICDEKFIHLIPRPSNKFYYSSAFGQFLKRYRNYDIYHAQGVWLYPTYVVTRLARKFTKPYIITARGMLYPQDMAKGWLKKQIFMMLFLKNDLQKAACVHVTCRQEMEHIRAMGIKSPIAVIPNPIDASGKDHLPISNNTLRVGYLGRLHPRKNIERLLYAWSDLGEKTQGRELIIIGGGDAEYSDFLMYEKERLALKNVIFTGFLRGEQKDEALLSLSFLVVPSDFENFGNIVTEALVCGIPVIASKGTPWEELQTHHCGWWIENDVATLVKTIDEALELSEVQRLNMGVRGKLLIKDNYTVEIVADKMNQLYDWVCGEGDKPQFVQLKK